MKKRVFIKVSRERQKKKWEKLILRPEIAERHGNAICPQSALFIKKMKKRVFTKASRERDNKKVGMVGKLGRIQRTP